ncbi:rab9 effector protein with kelch motifs-like isoform X2 [Gossypium australe]|uniref:Rab9 effector protein with kelch motifs-like isoform X2 n=1 Tax=Gossypium australe TaxID=47621 RepID=A0A5B6VZE6_9ROSI|nr:rab9 effector protein with kelch motifs-like isoform X2 [Gossypium australe]
MRVHISIPKHNPNVVAIGNKLVVYGGDCGDRYHGYVDVFDRDNSIWSRLTVQGSLLGVGASHATRFSHIVVFTKSDISIYGGCGEDKHPIKELLVLQLGTQYPNGCYNMCIIVGSHWTQEERRVLRVAQSNLRTMYLGDNEVSKQEAHEVEP